MSPATPNKPVFTMPSLRSALYFLLAAVLIAGCAGAREATEPVPMPHPLAGAWDFTIDSPRGTFTGTLVFSEASNTLDGMISPSVQPDRKEPLRDVMFDGETAKLSFSFVSGTYGMMRVTATLADDALDGLMNATQFGVNSSFKATRKPSQ